MKVDGYVGRVWPNGEFGLSKEKRFAPHRTIHRTSEEDRQWNAAMLNTHGLEECLKYRGIQLSDLMNGKCDPDHKGDVTEGKGGSATIGSVEVSNSHRPKRGQLGISRYGSKLIRNGAYVMEKESTASRLSFVTLTLPNVSADDAIACANGWAEIVRVFVQRLRRNLIRRGLNGEIVGCTEIQEKRAALTGVFGLHLHFCFVGRQRKHSWAIVPTELRDMWKSALKPFLSNDIDNYKWDACENMKPVKGNLSGYLGKYMSKGLKACQKLRAMFPNVAFPACWYICTSSLRNRVKRDTLRVSGELGRVVADLVECGDKELVAFCAPVKINWADAALTIGYMGRLTGRGTRMLACYIKDIRDEVREASLIICIPNVKEV